MAKYRLDLTDTEIRILEDALATHRTNTASDPTVTSIAFNNIIGLDAKVFEIRKRIISAQLQKGHI